MSARRGSGEGAIYKRADGKWCASTTVGYDANGERRRRVLYGKSKKEVQEKLLRLQADTLRGVTVDPQRVTVAVFMKRWLQDAARQSIRETTYRRYQSLIETNVVPHIGGIPIARLQAMQVQHLYTRLEEQGKSPRTRQFVHAVLRKAFQQAVKWGLVAKNVCADVERPKVQRRSAQVLSPEEVERFLAAAKDDRLFALYLVALTTGMRQGEMMALRWQDVDFRAGAISVQHTLQELPGKKSELAPPKSEKGRRRIKLPDQVTQALREHQHRMIAEGNPGPWVFCDTKGGPLRRYNFLRRSFEPLLMAAGVPKIPFHGLRHTAATLLLKLGEHPKVVQERLGHSQISVTLDTYSHVLPSMQEGAAAKLDALLAEFGSQQNQNTAGYILATQEEMP